MAKGIFSHPDESYTIQKRYLIKGSLKIGQNRPSVFARRLETLNGYLKYFPRRTQDNGHLARNNPITDDQLMEVMDEARPGSIQTLMINAKDSVTKFNTYDAYVHALDGWHDAVDLQSHLTKTKTDARNAKKKRKRDSDSDSKVSEQKANKRAFKRKKPCRHCKKMHPAPDDACWSLDKNKDNAPKRANPGKRKFVSEEDMENR